MTGVQKSSRKVRRSAVVVIATDGSPVDGLDMLGQCRQVWGYGTGITVPLVGNSVFHLVSTNTQDTPNRASVALVSRPKHTTQTNATHDATLNVSCILVSKDKHTELLFSAPRVPIQPHTTSTANKFQTDLADGLTSLSSATDALYSASSGASDQSLAPPVQDKMLVHVPMSLVGPAVVVLILSSAIAYRARKIKVQHKSDTRPSAAFPALRRSASLPVVTRYTNRTVEEDTASCKSLPAVLLSNDPSYSEIPDNVAAAQRPLPAIPQIYSVIPDAAAADEQPLDLSAQPHTIPDDDGMGHIPFYAASADISDTAYGVGSEGNQVFCSRHSIAVRKTAVYNSVIDTRDHHTSLYGKAPNIDPQQSKQAQGLKRILSIPRYFTVPKALLPREIPGKGPHDTTRRASLPLTPQNTFWPCEIPRKGSRNTQRRVSLPLTLPNTYWPCEVTGEGGTGSNNQHASLTNPPNSWPCALPSKGTINMPRHASLSELPNTYWPWEFREKETVTHHGVRPSPSRCLTPTGHGRSQRRKPVTHQGVSPFPSSPYITLTGHGRSQIRKPVTHQVVSPFPLLHYLTLTGHGRSQRRDPVTHQGVSPFPLSLPNTYWPWEIPEKETVTHQGVSPFPLTLPNTYWPWEIPEKETRNTPRLKETRNTPRRESLPPVTIPNTYWPWEIPENETRNTTRRTSLPIVSLPNTYWPWEISEKGTYDTTQRASLSKLPNTYWPWEIPVKETRSTPRRAPLPLTLPNTYWPWEITEKETLNTTRRKSLPIATLPNTYWPWEIPVKGTRNTLKRESLSLVTPPNTYWPWEISEKETRNTPRRESLPIVTLPNTYWPWEITENSRDTPRRASLSELPNTYWPWEILGEGTSDKSQRASLSIPKM
uniref:Uncharacterized protein n=1 Tax=Branchiostoma floridae TaxID=7739 RepID=C3YCC6_BRAFL|eukprot:XP_002605953.1 hypothetical protein BRAFLDRAFT_92219 [Branchiostoma floridae]